MPFLELRLNIFVLICLAVLNKLGCFLVLPLGSQDWQLFFTKSEVYYGECYCWPYRLASLVDRCSQKGHGLSLCGHQNFVTEPPPVTQQSCFCLVSLKPIEQYQVSWEAKESFILWSKNWVVWAHTLEYVFSLKDHGDRGCFIALLSAGRGGRRSSTDGAQLRCSRYSRLKCQVHRLCTQPDEVKGQLHHFASGTLV